jgi:hypothetical protein
VYSALMCTLCSLVAMVTDHHHGKGEIYVGTVTWDTSWGYIGQCVKLSHDIGALVYSGLMCILCFLVAMVTEGK